MKSIDRSTFHTGGRVGFLLVHGLGGTPVEMRFVAQGLARAGYTVSCCQLAGHCATVDDLRTSTWQQWYASVEEAHDRLKAVCDVVIVGGLSMGSMLALHLAQNRPTEVHGLSLFAPTLWMNGWSTPWYARALRYVRPTRLKLELNIAENEPYGIKDERIRSFVVQSMLGGDSSAAGVFSTPLRSLAQFNCLVDAVKPRLGQLKMPALILHPREDDIADIDNSMYLQRKLGGLVNMVVLDDSYHIITLDRQRHVVVEKCVAFASSLATSFGLKDTVVKPIQVNAAE
jgi:carboxylesterase